ncbi:hypothetical protein HMPREF0536_10881 [Limosilactobacillus reuteri MM4-1A]|uniref:Uncharacterized protein n=1 Tax=Limosilactobacillus reuteri MM4-1A TaxID=548485 RepID=A0A828RHP6_LIMRT|nr:hypothetical protein HMPREF0536_10881 [Limosilactobacillus reuteri MM4-1A]
MIANNIIRERDRSQIRLHDHAPLLLLKDNPENKSDDNCKNSNNRCIGKMFTLSWFN